MVSYNSLVELLVVLVGKVVASNGFGVDSCCAFSNFEGFVVVHLVAAGTAAVGIVVSSSSVVVENLSIIDTTTAVVGSSIDQGCCWQH